MGFTSRWPAPNAAFSRLRIYDLASHNVRTLAEGAGDVSQPTISDDGSQVLFLSTARFSGTTRYGPAQAFLIGLNGSAPRQFTNDPAGIQSAVLSGNGRVAFVFTNGGRLPRVDLDAFGENTERIPLTPLCCSASTAAAGSLHTIYDFGPYDSAGNPPVSSSPSQFTFLVPWEPMEQTATISLSLTFDSSFELPAPATQPGYFPVARKPQFFTIPTEYGTRQSGYGAPIGKAVHQNFEGLITQDSPARPGEIVHLYAKGLGPVDATGRDGDLSTLFAGLSLGIAGVNSASPLPQSPFSHDHRDDLRPRRYDAPARFPLIPLHSTAHNSYDTFVPHRVLSSVGSRCVFDRIMVIILLGLRHL